MERADNWAGADNWAKAGNWADYGLSVAMENMDKNVRQTYGERRIWVERKICVERSWSGGWERESPSTYGAVVS